MFFGDRKKHKVEIFNPRRPKLIIFILKLMVKFTVYWKWDLGWRRRNLEFF